ncbi:hypothetical protein Hanom_Chr13g01189521 [Helianthus anomalus]
MCIWICACTIDVSLCTRTICKVVSKQKIYIYNMRALILKPLKPTLYKYYN